MTQLTQADRDGAVLVYPDGYKEFGEPDPKAEAEASEFEKFKAEMLESDEQPVITVSKQPLDSNGNPRGKKLFQCFSANVDDYTFHQLCQRIREEHGTGLYRIQGRDSKGKFVFNKSIGIEAPKNQLPANAENSMAGIMREMRESMNQQMEMMQNLMIPSGPVQDPIDQMTKMMAAMGAMMGAMGINAQPPKSLTEQLTEMTMVKSLMQDLGGNNDEGSGNLMGLLTATVQNIGPILGMALKAGQKDGTVNSNGIIQPAIEAPRMENEIMNETEQLNAMKPQLEFLVTQAKGGAESFDVAQFVLKAIPDEQLENVEAFLQQEKCIEKCISVYPDIKEHQTWFEKWRGDMLNGLAEILDDGSDVIEPDDKDLTDSPGVIKKDAKSEAGNSDGSESIASSSSTETSSDT